MTIRARGGLQDRNHGTMIYEYLLAECARFSIHTNIQQLEPP